MYYVCTHPSYSLPPSLHCHTPCKCIYFPLYTPFWVPLAFPSPPLQSLTPTHPPLLLHCILHTLPRVYSSFQVLTSCSVQPHQYIYELYSKVKRRWVRLSRAHSMGNLKELVHKATYCIQLCVQRVAERLNEAV